MSRDSNGIYTLPPSNPVVTDTTIAIGWANPTMSDIGAEITNSLPRDGSAAMTNHIKAPDGSAAAPTYTFSSDTGTGVYRKSAGPELALSVSAADKLTISTNYVTAGIAIKTPAIVGTQQTITVAAGGVAAPANPFAGNPFDTLANAIAFANTVTQANNTQLKIVLTSGVTYPLTANLTVSARVAISTTTPASAATISGLFTLSHTDNASYQDITFTNNGLSPTFCKIEFVSGCTFNSSTLIVTAIHGELQFNAATTFTNGDITVKDSSVLKALSTLTLSDGMLFITGNSIVYAEGTLSVTSSTTDAIRVYDNSSLIVDGTFSSTASTGSTPLDARWGSSVRTGGAVTLTNTAGSSVGLYVEGEAGVYFNGTNSLTINVGALGLAIATRMNGFVSIPTGKTVTLPGAGKTISVGSGGINYIVPTIAGAVYSPVLGTATAGLGLNTAVQ